ncbi:MAG: hypothetical protein HYU57_03960 [Micavibrio aeruginosavorus]|nr:hypothetical protein [Micavibrio aeruginosavorus]
MDKYENLPPEWKKPEFLEAKIDESRRLRNTFGVLAALGWTATIAIDKRPDSTELQGVYKAAFTGACFSTGLAVLGTVAIVKMKKFLAQAKAEQKKPPENKPS